MTHHSLARGPNGPLHCARGPNGPLAFTRIMGARSQALRFAALCASALAVASAPNRAAAAGFDVARIGGERGHATTETPFATYYNPAALANTKKIHIAGDLTLVFHSAEYNRTQSTTVVPADASNSNTGKATLFNTLAAPSLAGSMKFGDFAVGLSVMAPMSGSQDWGGNKAYKNNDQYPGVRDGQARWQMIQGEQLTLYTTLAASYTIPSIRLSFGAGANLIYQKVRLLRARTGAGDDALAQEGRINMDLSGLSGSFSLGTQWEAIANRLWLGLSYQAPPGLYGGQTVHGTLDSWLLTARPGSEKVQLVQKLPDVIRWGVRYRQEGKYELRLFGDYTRWSTMERQCLVKEDTTCKLGDSGLPEGPNVVNNHERQWKDAFTVRAGASYWVLPQLEAFVGLGYENSAVKARFLEPGLIDGRDVSVALGGRWTLGEHVGLLLSYTHIQMINRTVKYSQLDQLEIGTSRLPTGAGEYKQWFGMLNGIAEFYFN